MVFLPTNPTIVIRQAQQFHVLGRSTDNTHSQGQLSLINNVSAVQVTASTRCAFGKLIYEVNFKKGV